MSADELFGATVHGWRKESKLGMIIPLKDREVGIVKKSNNYLKKQNKNHADKADDEVCIHQVSGMISPPEDELRESEIDMQLICEVRDEIKLGEYHIPAGKIAEAMLEEILWVEKWLF